jgi:hypothetical protein
MAMINGGAKIAEYLIKLGDQLKGDPHVKVGFLSGSSYPDGTPVAAIAAANEFGVSVRGQPPRPFFRNMIQRNSNSWPVAIADLMRAHDNNVKKALDLVGQGVAGQLRQSIVDLTDPPLAPSTIARKGSSKPLVDTGHMLQSVDYEVSA